MRRPMANVSALTSDSDHTGPWHKRSQELEKELAQLRIELAEMQATNGHLISATWRERDLKAALARTVAELEATKKVLDAQNRRVQESVNYARNIQVSLLPAEGTLRKHFQDSFMLYKPRDVVSGDFPWIFDNGTSVYLAAVDCTGHGVPGAMLSVIGCFLLNGIVAKEPDLPCGVILDRLHAELQQVLGQKDPKSLSRDGMDIALCKVDKQARTLEFSGAHRPLYVLGNDGLQEVKGDRYPIGGAQYRNRAPFTTHTLTIQEGQAFYLFTDGLVDQFGGQDGKEKITSRRVQGLLQEQNRQGLSRIGAELDAFFNTWKGEHHQLDDVLVIGLRPLAPAAVPSPNGLPEFAARTLADGLQKALLVHTVDFSQQQAKAMMAQAEKALLERNLPEGARKKTLNVAIEAFQNLSKHYTPVHAAPAFFVISEDEEHLHILTGDPIASEHVSSLQAKLEHINSLSNTALAVLFKEARRKSNISSVGGAGLGFIDMAKRTGNKLSYRFERISDTFFYFTLAVPVNKQLNP
jgi:serine phosphatase RsbU (regulator of sigma subunit)